MLGLLNVIFRTFVSELWPLIDVRITLPLNILRHSGLLLHARHCSGAIVRFSDNSSFFLPDRICDHHSAIDELTLISEN